MLYQDLVQVYEELESTSKRLKKTFIISRLIKKFPDELDKILLLLQGKVFPTYSDKKIGVASRTIIKAISTATGFSTKRIEEEWKKTGDLGDVVYNFVSRKKQRALFSQKLTVDKVFSNIKTLAEFEGAGTVDKKLQLISELLTSAEPNEAKYIVRTILEVLRVGVGKGSIRDAIVWAYFSDQIGLQYEKEDNLLDLNDEQRKKYNEYINAVQHGYDLTNEFSVVVKTIKEKGIDGINDLSIEVGKPVNVMLFLKAEDIEDAFKTVGMPAAFEYKLDGFRLQCHKKDKTQLFTRRLDEVSTQFPEVVACLKNIDADSFIIDAEAVGYDPKTGNYLAFQNISQRIKRKYHIKKMAAQFPVELHIFDIIEYNGKTLLKEPFKKRREILEKIVTPKDKKIRLVEQIVTEDKKEAEEFYAKALSLGFEGIMAKNLKGIYKPGARVGYGVKIKPTMEPLDLVIVGAEYGEGKRSGWLTSFITACWNSNKEELLEIGKVSTGLKELDDQGLSFKKMTNLLKPLIKKSSGKKVIVKPEIVIEVLYEEIQKSPTYSSGYALRFPRVSRLRTMEKGLQDINTIQDVEKLYAQQT